MTNDLARAAVLVGALVTGGSLVGNRAPVPSAPPAEVRTFQAPPAAPLAQVAPVVAPPLPAPRPKITPEAKPKPKATKPPLKKSLPSCEHIRRERARMSLSEQFAAYQSASAEEIAHGKRCLGF